MEVTRVLSGSEFLSVLCHEALLAKDNQRLFFIDSPDPAALAQTREEEWHWLAPLVAAFVEALLDDATAHGRVLIHTSIIQDPAMQNLGYRTSDKLPLFQDWFVSRAVYRATEALCFSPRFLEPMMVERRGRRFRFSRFNGSNVTVEPVTALQPTPS